MGSRPADDVCVIVPAYNESAVIGSVVMDLRNHFRRVLVIDDGSNDDTCVRAREAGALVLRHPINLGQGAALQTGLLAARRMSEVAYVVTFDADGQHDAGDASRMVDLCRNGDYDVVLGSRALGSAHRQPRARRLIRLLALRFSRRLSGLDLTDTHNGLRALNRVAFTSLELSQPGMAHASELERQIATLGLRWAESAASVRYTAYSLAKGQANLNAVNVVYDLLLARLRGI